MATYTVTNIRKEYSADRSHKHLEGVITSGGVHYTRREVVDRINRGDVWTTSADGYSAKIHVIGSCWRRGCTASPYIETNRDSTKLDNLENLPEG